MKKTLLLLGVGALAYTVVNASNIATSAKRLQINNPRVKFGKASLTNVQAEVTIDIFNPGSTDIPVDYFAGNIIYNGRQVSRFTFNGSGQKVYAKARTSTPFKFEVSISNLNSASTIYNIIKNLTAGNPVSSIVTIDAVMYALGMDMPFQFSYDVIKQMVVAKSAAIGSVKATLEFSSNNELEKYFGNKRASKKLMFSRN